MADGPFRLNDDGTVTFDFDEAGVRTLRRPKLKQYRALVEALNKMRRDLLPDAKTEEEIEAAAAEIDVDQQFDALLTWIRLAFDTLGDGPLPDEDDLPTWLLNGQVPRDLVQHWIEIPTRRGAQ